MEQNTSCSINLVEDVFGSLFCQCISDNWTALETSHHNAEMRGHQTGALKQWRIKDHQSLTRNRRLGRKESKKRKKYSQKTHPSW